MSENWVKFLQVLAALFVASIFVWWCDLRVRPRQPETVVIERIDTLVVRDTITAYKPVPFNVYVVDTVWYEVPVYGGRDTVYLPLPMEVKEYRDSSYRAVVSGIRPSLDTIDVYQRTVTISKTETVVLEPSPWSIGIQAGYDASKDGLTPYLGVGVQYKIWSPKTRKAPP